MANRPAWKDSYGLSKWQGYLTNGEVTALQTLAKQTPPSPLVVNIGAGAGTSTLAILEARSDALIFSIDLRTDEAECLTNEHLRLKELGLDTTGQVIRVWGDSKVVGLRWRWPVDLLFVDGDHTLAGIKGDVATWEQHIAPGGIIALHDYGRPEWPDVRTFIDDHFRLPVLLQTDTVIAFRLPEASGW